MRNLRSLSFVALLLGALAGPGCSCSKPTDEQRLRKEIDTSAVHLYLSAKIAVHPTAGGADVKDARAAFGKILALAFKGREQGDARLSASDAKSLALALFELRKLGKEAFAKDRVDVPAPILPALLKLAVDGGHGDGDPDLAELVDANTEHAVLLTGLTLIKLHPKSPAPIPPPLLLYEAWWTKAEALPLPTLAIPVHAVKAYTFATSKLCDLASRDANAIPATPEVDDNALRADLGKLTGKKPPMRAEQVVTLMAGASALAHGMTAICYVERGDTKLAVAHMRRFLDAAKALGVEGPEADVLRGWGECMDGDPKAGQALLRKVKDAPEASKDARKAATDLLEVCAASQGKLQRALSSAIAVKVVVEAAWRALTDSGLPDALETTPVVRGVRAFGNAMGDTLDGGKKHLPDLEDVGRAKGGVFDRLRALWGG